MNESNEQFPAIIYWFLELKKETYCSPLSKFWFSTETNSKFDPGTMLFLSMTGAPTQSPPNTYRYWLKNSPELNRAYTKLAKWVDF